MPQNPLTKIQFEIPFDSIRPEHIQPAIDTLISQAETELQSITEASEPRTYENTLGAIDRLGETFWFAFRLVGHLEGVVTTPELRAAYNAALPKVSAFSSKLQMSEGLYQALKDYAKTQEAKQLSPTKARYLKLSLDGFRRQGADLPEDKKAQLEAINTRLSEITTQYRQNVTDSTAAWEMYLDEQQIQGLPQSAIDQAQQSAASKGKEGFRFTTQVPSYLAVMTHLDDADLRKQFYLAYNTRATEEGRDNRPLLEEILKLRRNKAELLGYANYGDYVLEDRMAHNAKQAVAFEQNLKAKSQKAFEREIAELQAFRDGLMGTHQALEPWDIRYFVEKQRKARFDFDEEQLRPYFSLEGVLQGLFDICKRVFGIEVRENPSIKGWHPEVKTYDIFDQNQFVARFYTDWFPRDSKRGGAWMNAFIMGDRANGKLEPHLGLMCGNLTPPVGDKPALLTHREVETVFHEFGHLLHHSLSNVEVKSLAGTSTPWDFVELPSQIMENWCWEREALNLFARHYQTGESIPDELFQKMKQAQTYWAANQMMRQLMLGSVDLALHVEFNPGLGNPMEFAQSYLEQFSSLPMTESASFIASFSHIFGSPIGYAAGYYSYMWAEVLDADAFSRFKQEGIFNAQTGADFVAHILSKGNSQDPQDLFRGFMGREPNPNALLARSGLLD